MRKSAVLLCLVLCAVCSVFTAPGQVFHIKEGEITNGYVVRKIWLGQYRVPEITAHDLNYIPVASVPPGTPVSFPDKGKLTVHIGMERKRPFALVQVPVYAREGEQLMRLAAFTLTVKEDADRAEAASTGTVQARLRTTGTQSALATGAWHKISVDRRGIYKVDYDFLKHRLNLTGTVPSAAIRLLGHGGTMLSENNAIPRHNDPPENALQMHDGGDGTFGPGDYFLFYATGPMGWIKDSVNQRFVYQKNLYEDKSY